MPLLAHALSIELQAWARTVRGWRLYALLAAFALGLVLAVQRPLDYHVDVGVGEGYGGDLPMLQGFNDAERDEHGTYRWTDDGARVLLPGVGARPLAVRLRFFPVGGRVAEDGPKQLELWSGDERLATLPVRPEGFVASVSIPARLVSGGDLALTLRTATFAPGGDDPRRLGTPLDALEVVSLAAPSVTAPNWGVTLTWLAAALVVFALLARMGFGANEALVGAGIGAALALLSALLDPPRFAFGAAPALIAAALCYALLLALLALLPAFARSLHGDIAPAPRRYRWLLLVLVLSFGLRYGGRLYPESMGGDINFHYNRMTEVIKGRVIFLSRNRGVDFPYPPGPYVALAPFALTGLPIRTILQLGAALVEGAGALLVYIIAAVSFARQRRRGATHARSPNPTATLAAAIYGLAAAGFMTTWWSFDTHIYTQFFSVLLTTVVIALFERRAQSAERRTGGSQSVDKESIEQQRVFMLHPSSFILVAVLLSLVFLGHFGFFINTVLLGGMLVALVWWLAWRGRGWARAVRWPATLAYGGALLVALLLFYSAFAGLFIAQAQAVAAGGLTGAAQRAPVPRWQLWQVLWQAGIVTHFGFFPLALAPVGLLIYACQASSVKRQASAVTILMACSFLVSLAFAALPFITQSTQSTRWLMFSAWAVAVGGAVAARRLWRSGWAGRIAVIAMAAFVLWNTAAIWLGAMLWRIRPPEPF